MPSGSIAAGGSSRRRWRRPAGATRRPSPSAAPGPAAERALAPAPEKARAREELAAADPKLARLIEHIDHARIESRLAERTTNRFEALLRIIVGQQVSTAAARTIWGRLLESFGGPPGPERMTADDVTGILRRAGLSGRKASYAIGIAEAVIAGEFDPDGLEDLSDEEVIETLVALRGLGRWSAEMFLIFDLGRPDVFSGGDLGLRRGIQIAYGLDEPPSPEEAIAIAEVWSPNRSLASLYLWEAAGIGLPIEVPEN